MQGRGPYLSGQHAGASGGPSGDVEKRLIVDIWQSVHPPKPSQAEIREFFPFFHHLLTGILRPHEPCRVSPENIGATNYRIIKSITCYNAGLPPGGIGRRLLTHLLGPRGADLDLIRGDHGQVAASYTTLMLIRVR